MKSFFLGSSKTLILVFIGWLLLIIGCVHSGKRQSADTAPNKNINVNSEAVANKTSNNKNDSNRANTIEESDEFKSLSSAEHFAEAKKLYENKPSDYELYVTALHLKAIPETALEFNDAQAILKKIEKKVKSQVESDKTDSDALQVVNSRWRRGAFGAAGIWTVTFYNKSDKHIGDINYQTRYYSETGNDLGGTGGFFSSGEVQKIIPPRQKRTIQINDGFIHKEAASANFTVTDWRFVAP